jgi:hypothetical protein
MEYLADHLQILRPKWRDFSGVVHECRAVDVNDAFLLIMTLCDRFVPPNARYAESGDAHVNCTDCASKQQ